MKRLKYLIPAYVLSTALIACTGGGGDTKHDKHNDARTDDAASESQEKKPDPTGTKCSYDWDCPVNYVCREKDGADGKYCKAATADDERYFGEANLVYDEDNPQYLMAIYGIPAGDEASLADVAYNISVAEDEADDGASDDGSSDNAAGGSVSKISAEWQARLAFDSRRYEGISRQVRDLRAGRRHWNVRKDKDLGCQSGCAANELCINDACTDGATFNMFKGETKVPVKTKLMAVAGDEGRKVAVFVDVEDTEGVSASGPAEYLADDFATIIMPRDLAFFNDKATHSGHLDRDGNGVMSVVLSSKLCDLGVLGYFDYRDYLPAGDAEASGNEADILWVRALKAEGSCEDEASGPKVLGTIAHEYQHLISYGRRVYLKNDNAKQELLWLDEGLAHLAEDISGFGASNYPTIASYIGMFDNVSFCASYPMSGSTAAQHVAGRGAAYLFMRYMFEAQGGAEYSATDASVTDKGGIAFLQKLYSGDYFGLTNVEKASGISRNDFFKNFAELMLFDSFEDARLHYNAPVKDELTGYIRGISLDGEEPFVDADGEDNYLVIGEDNINFDYSDSYLDEVIENTIGEGVIHYYFLYGEDDEGARLWAASDPSFDGRVLLWRGLWVD